jgi:hypothetical protein
MAGEPGRWCLRCVDAGVDCTLSLAGEYDEVLDEGVAHWRRVHHARGEDAEVRGAVAELMRRQDIDLLSRS